MYWVSSVDTQLLPSFTEFFFLLQRRPTEANLPPRSSNRLFIFSSLLPLLILLLLLLLLLLLRLRFVLLFTFSSIASSSSDVPPRRRLLPCPTAQPPTTPRPHPQTARHPPTLPAHPLRFGSPFHWSLYSPPPLTFFTFFSFFFDVFFPAVSTSFLVVPGFFFTEFLLRTVDGAQLLPSFT